jgi:hypothetical protein
MRGFIIISLLLITASVCRSQDLERDVVQFSGVVVTEDSTMGIPGVHLYVPKGGRGSSTNPYGYFSFPVLEGDSVIISAVGFKRRFVKIPYIDRDNLTIVIPMKEDTTYLQNVNIMPFPTEEMFKEAVLAMRLPNQRDITNMDRNLDPSVLAQIYRNMPMDGSMNHRFFTQTQAEYMFDSYGPRPNPLLNPFAWADFFKSLKKKKK